MISYKDFIFERLISESILQYSDGFSKILSRINLPIAKNLLQIKGKDVSAPQNYIDLISNEDDMVTFITDTKAIEILGDKKIEYKITNGEKFLNNSIKNKDTFDRLGIDLGGDYFNDPEEGDIGQILSETLGNNKETYVLFEYTDSVEDEKVGKKVVLNKSCLVSSEKIDISKLWTSNRNKVKIGRFARSILRVNDIKFTDKEIEEFVNSYKSEIELLNNAFMKFEIVEGDLIAKYYNQRTYYLPSNGTLGNSCMKNVPDDFFYIYSQNPDRVKMIILYNDLGSISNGKYRSDHIQGRALLWKTDQGDMIVDRIYTNFDKDVDLFKKFAENNGWWCKRNQNSSCSFVAQMGEQTKVPIYTITLSKSDFDCYPYLDTFAYFNGNTGVLTNNEDMEISTHIMDNTGGTLSLIER